MPRDVRSGADVYRRLIELTWAGITPAQIGEATGRPAEVIEALYDAPVISPETCAAIGRAYKELMPPDIDEIAVERVLDWDYDPHLLTRPERREVVRQLVLSRKSNSEIAEVLQKDDRTVQRDVTYLGLTGHRTPEDADT